MSRLLFLKLALVLGLITLVGRADASVITFVPPNDVSGSVFTTNDNDGWDAGRGVVFTVLNDVTIDSIGLFNDFTGINLSYEIAQVPVTSGTLTLGQTVLRSGSAVVSTNGLEWTDFGIAPLTLVSGNNYHIEFTFSGNANQNFYFNNANSVFSLGDFAQIDGTREGNTSNSVMPGIRINTFDNSAVPEPSSIVLFGLCACFAGGGVVLQRRRKK